MHAHSTRLSWLGLAGLLFGLQACSTPMQDMSSDADLGKSVRAALRAQELPSRPASPAGVPFVELQQGLDSQQKAHPPVTTVNRTGQSPVAKPVGL